jgi:hypothetical protein
MIGDWPVVSSQVPRIQPTYNAQKLQGLIERRKKVSGVDCRDGVGIDYTAARGSAAFIQINDLAKCMERLGREACITVKQQNQGCAGYPDGLITRHAEAQIGLVKNRCDLRMVLMDGFDTTIAGGVVYQDDLDLCGVRALKNGRQALEQKVPGIVTDDNNGNLG